MVHHDSLRFEVHPLATTRQRRHCRCHDTPRAAIVVTGWRIHRVAGELESVTLARRLGWPYGEQARRLHERREPAPLSRIRGLDVGRVGGLDLTHDPILAVVEEGGCICRDGAIGGGGDHAGRCEGVGPVAGGRATSGRRGWDFHVNAPSVIPNSPCSAAAGQIEWGSV